MTCPKCSGRGYIYLTSENPMYPPSVQTCDCQLVRNIRDNVNKGWIQSGSPLFDAPKIKESLLTDLTKQDVWITGTVEALRKHLRHVAIRQGAFWHFRVASDSDLMTSWLSSTVLKRAEIFDADVAENTASISSKMHSLVDYVIPPELLIIFLGVKSSRNSAMPEVFQETLTSRAFAGKPTWVVDQPNQPFNSLHMCYSEPAERTMMDFKRVTLPYEKPKGVSFMGQAMDNSPSPHIPTLTMPTTVVRSPFAVDLPTNVPIRGTMPTPPAIEIEAEDSDQDYVVHRPSSAGGSAPVYEMTKRPPKKKTYSKIGR